MCEYVCLCECVYVRVTVCVCVSAIESSPTHQPGSSSQPAEHGSVQQRAAEIQRQLQVCGELISFSRLAMSGS